MVLNLVALPGTVLHALILRPRRAARWAAGAPLLLGFMQHSKVQSRTIRNKHCKACSCTKHSLRAIYISAPSAAQVAALLGGVTCTLCLWL